MSFELTWPYWTLNFNRIRWSKKLLDFYLKNIKFEYFEKFMKLFMKFLFKITPKKYDNFPSLTTLPTFPSIYPKYSSFFIAYSIEMLRLFSSHHIQLWKVQNAFCRRAESLNPFFSLSFSSIDNEYNHSRAF